MNKRLKKKIAKNQEKRTEKIFKYAAYGDLGKIKKLLDFGVDINKRDQGGLYDASLGHTRKSFRSY
jgi:hypothetical protein